MASGSSHPLCIVIAGPSGAGKTTFAREFLPSEAGIARFINGDLIAGGLSPLNPSLAAAAAARVMLEELDRLAKARENFAFESTLSGLAYARRLTHWKASGYRIQIVFLRLDSPELALKRIAERVKEGGRDVSRKEVLRRFDRGLPNFRSVYGPLADAWDLYDNSGSVPKLMETST